jgi:hypothetical protein
MGCGYGRGWNAVSVAAGGLEEEDDSGKTTGGGCIGGFVFLEELRLLDSP